MGGSWGRGWRFVGHENFIIAVDWFLKAGWWRSFWHYDIIFVCEYDEHGNMRACKKGKHTFFF